MKLGTYYKRKARNSARQFIYQLIWQEAVPKRMKKSGGRSTHDRPRKMLD